MDSCTGEVFKYHCDHAGYEKEIAGWLASLPAPVLAAYEAGPTGYGLYRCLEADGIACQVAAPSKLLRPTGDKVKTDRKDAQHLEGLVRAGLITCVRVPSAKEEAIRDLLRAREAVRRDLMRVRHRVSKLLLRHGIVYDKTTTWSGGHLSWLAHQRFEIPETQMAFENNLAAAVEMNARLDGLDNQLVEILPGSGFEPVVTALSCLRGVAMFTAFALAVEIGDWSRFTGSSIGNYLGLTPSENSSGQSRHQGGITKAGNKHARRLVIEAAWQHRRAFNLAGSAVSTRQALASPLIRARANQANRRLHNVWRKFDAREKLPVVANAAVARELSGFCWSLAMMATT